MNFLLINSPLFREKNIFNNEDSLPPIGLGYIASYLKQGNIDVELIDAVYNRIPLKNLIDFINKKQPEFVGINIFSTNYELVKELVESIDINTHVIIGGLATKELYNEIINWNYQNQIDIVIGDGELITYDIIKNQLKENAIFLNQTRRVFKVTNESIYFLKNISDIPLDRNFFRNDLVKNHMGLLEANIITGRGCIYNCTFCAAARSQNTDFTVRERTETSIINELRVLKDKYPEINSIRILDDLFLKSEQCILKAVNIFSKLDLKWRSMAHIKAFDNIPQREIVDLRESGCNELFIGMESGSPKILNSINKTHKREQLIKIVSKIFTAKINIKGYFIYGFPNETEDDMNMTYDLACEIKNLSVKYGTHFRTSVFQFRPYHGTKIYNDLKNINESKKIGPIKPNQELSDLIGRFQFNFHGENYSEVCLNEIHSYICITNKLNESDNFSQSRQ